MTQTRRFPVQNPKCRVLCVDDHHDTSEMLQMLLSEENYEVHTAATIAEACHMADGDPVRSLRPRQAPPRRHRRRVVRDINEDLPLGAVHLLHRRRLRDSPARSLRGRRRRVRRQARCRRPNQRRPPTPRRQRVRHHDLEPPQFKNINPERLSLSRTFSGFCIANSVGMKRKYYAVGLSF